MRKFLGISLTIALGLTTVAAVPVAAESENSRNNIGDIVQIGDNFTWLLFGSANEVKTFFVSIPDGSGGDSRNGRLTVETQDGFCCTDYWGVRIIKHNGQVMASAVGDGSGAGSAPPVSPDDWSGAATIPALPQKGVTVEVYYDHGSDIFGAGMWVRFSFTGENIEVTPVP
jgi:hypothetical protein